MAAYEAFARRDRQAYTLLHMHVVKDTKVQEIAQLQGMSRSAVYRSLSRRPSFAPWLKPRRIENYNLAYLIDQTEVNSVLRREPQG